MPVYRNMKKGDFKYLYSIKISCCTWLDGCSVIMLFSNVKRNGKKIYYFPPTKKD